MDVLDRVQERAAEMVKRLEERLREQGLFRDFCFNGSDFVESGLDAELALDYSLALRDNSRTCLVLPVSCTGGPPGNIQL